MKKFSKSRRSLAWAATVGLSVFVSGCNLAAGSASLVAVGGIAYLGWRCYDHVAISVRDLSTGSFTCDATVTVSSLDDPDVGWTLQPCYHVALTPGRWKLTAQLPGSESASTEVEISERGDECPHFTHTVELSLWPKGKSRSVRRLKSRQVNAPPAVVPGSNPVLSPSASPAPTRAFEIAPDPPK